MLLHHLVRRVFAASLCLLLVISLTAVAHRDACAQDSALDFHGGTVAPRLRESSPVTFPQAAMDADVQADVVVRIDIEEDGSVSDVRALQLVIFSYDQDDELYEEELPVDEDEWGFVDAAISAASTYRFSPAREITEEHPDGNPVPSRIAWRIGFVIYYTETTTEMVVETAAGPPTGVNTHSQPAASDVSVASQPAAAPAVVSGPQAAPESAPVSVSGYIRRRGTRQAVVFADVNARRAASPADEVPAEVVDAAADTDSGASAPTEIQAEADERGYFELRGMEPGSWRVSFVVAGELVHEENIEVDAGRRLERTWYVNVAAEDLFRSRTTARAVVEEVSRLEIVAADVADVAGTDGDVVKAVNNFPGVHRPPFGTTPFGRGSLPIRGSSPEATSVYVDGVRVPILYHFGGLRTIIPAEMVDAIDFHPGGFGASWGRATGGLINLNTRVAGTEGVHGHVDVNVFEAGLRLEAAISDQVAVFGAVRRSYAGDILRPVLRKIDSLDFDGYPRFWDFQFGVTSRRGPGSSLTFLFIGADDLLDVSIDDGDEQEDDAQFNRQYLRTVFQSLSLSWTERLTPTLHNQLTLSFSRPQVTLDIGGENTLQVFEQDKAVSIGLREAITWLPHDGLRLRVGVDILGRFGEFVYDSPVALQERDDPTASLTSRTYSGEERYEELNAAVYVEVETEVAPGLTVVPGLRAEYYDAFATTTVEPRLALRYAIDEQLAVTASGGLYHRSPDRNELRVEGGNPDLKIERAAHYGLGADFVSVDGFRLNAGVFYKSLSRLPATSNRIPESENVDDGETGEGTGEAGEQREAYYLESTQRGRAYGFELLLRYDGELPLSGWVSYTLSQAERRDGRGSWFPFSYDQTHIATFVLDGSLPRSWSLGARWRYTTGRPYTQRTGSATDVTTGVRHIALSPDVNTLRLQAFHQLDIRVAKDFTFKRWSLSTYINFNNVYNRSNQEVIVYPSGGGEDTIVTGLPFIPAFGVRAEW